MSSHSPARRRAPSVSLLVAILFVLSVTAVYATDTSAAAGADRSAQPATAAASPAAPVSEQAAVAAQSLITRPRLFTHRPGALVPLYASFAVLQALDAHSTLTAINMGATEANPLLRGVASHPGALLAVKMGAAVGTIFVAEKLWKRNPVAAVALMVGLNSAYAMIVAHNYQLGNR